MPYFTIMHIFEVPARNQYEATDELMTARKHNYDKVYLKKVLVREAGLKLPRDKVNVFEPKEPKKPAKQPAKWAQFLSGRLPANSESYGKDWR
jgi:hypothetical protein